MIDNLVYKGFWFLPNNQEKQITGTLTYDPVGSANLELLGTLVDFHKSSVTYDLDFILGITVEGKKITLYKSYLNSWSRLSDMDITKYMINFIIVGAHYFTDEDFVFTNIRIRLKNLNNWVNQIGFKRVNFNSKDKSYNIHYQIPSPIKFNINEDLTGQFNFSFQAPANKYIHKAIVEQQTEIIVENNKVKPFFDFVEVLELFQNFFTLATFEPASVIAVWLTDNTSVTNGVVAKKEVVLIYNSIVTFKNEEQKSFRDFLFNYKDIELNFEQIIQKWFSQKELIHPITGLLFESFYNKKRFNENSFLNIVQALETFHRRFRQNTILPKLEHKNKIDKILSSVDPEYKSWLNEKLCFSNEPTLHSRLIELISELSNKTIDNIIVDKDTFILKTRNSRNYYTHYDEKLKSKSVPLMDLYALTEKLKVLLIALVLLETGFTKDNIEVLFERNEYKFFNHILPK